MRKSKAKQIETMDQRLEAEDLRQETMDQRAESRDRRPEIRDDEQRPGTSGCHRAENAEQRPACSDSRPETQSRDQKFETGDRRLGRPGARCWGVVVFFCCCLFPLFFVSWALHEGGVAGVVEGLALWSGAFPLWSAWDER